VEAKLLKKLGRSVRVEARSFRGQKEGGADRLEETLASHRVIRVLIVDDEPFFQLGLAMSLADDERLEFAGGLALAQGSSRGFRSPQLSLSRSVVSWPSWH